MEYGYEATNLIILRETLSYTHTHTRTHTEQLLDLSPSNDTLFSDTYLPFVTDMAIRIFIHNSI